MSLHTYYFCLHKKLENHQANSAENAHFYSHKVTMFMRSHVNVLVYFFRKIFWSDWGWEPKIESATMDGGKRSLVMRLDNGSWPNALTLDMEGITL